jgi:hypothetical protein
LAFAVVATASLSAAATTSSRPRSKSDRLLVLRGGWLSEMIPGTSGKEWQEHRLAPLPQTGESYPHWSGPAVSPSGAVLVAMSRYSGLGEQSEDDTAVSLYTWTRGQTALRPGPQFRMFGGGSSGYAVLDDWVRGERLLAFRVSIAEGLAQTTVAKLGAPGKAALDSAADDSERRVLRRFGRHSYLMAAAYCQDGRLFAGANYKRIALYDRRSHRIRMIRTPVKYVWCMSFSDDGRAIAWIGEVGKSNPRPPAESGADYIPNLDAIGVTWVSTGKTSVYRLGKFRGYEGIGAFGDQTTARIRINSTEDTLFFFWKDGLARFSRPQRKLEVIARKVDGFGLVR